MAPDLYGRTRADRRDDRHETTDQKADNAEQDPPSTQARATYVPHARVLKG